MSDRRQTRPLDALGLASQASLGNELCQLHQRWLFEEAEPQGTDEVVARQAALGRQVNQLLLSWMDRVLAREGVRQEQAEVVMALAPGLEMRGRAQ